MKPAELIRTKNICLHCPKIKIHQKTESGIVVYGYGYIKINNTGNIYLEYVCTKSKNIPKTLGKVTIPQDSLSNSEMLHLEAESINGRKFVASGFKFQIENPAFLDKFSGVVFLSEIKSEYKDNLPHSADNFLHLEFNEKCVVTKNKSNSITSTLGSESHSRNQAEFKINNINYSIISHDNHTEVIVTGQFDVQIILESILFYVGFTSGTNPQPYYIRNRVCDHVSELLLSIDDRVSKCETLPVLPTYCVYENNPDYFYTLLDDIIKININNKKAFDSCNAQWLRTWHSFNSPHSILMLTLSVAIEGLLNDLYKGCITNKLHNPIFEEIKLDVIDKIKITDINPEHQTTIINHIKQWGNIYPSKMLEFMISHKSITSKEKKSWSSLRNKSAHPTNSSTDPIKNTKELELIYDCINIFNKLVLNTFNYDGPYYSYSIQNNDVLEFKHIDYTAL